MYGDLDNDQLQTINEKQEQLRKLKELGDGDGDARAGEGAFVPFGKGIASFLMSSSTPPRVRALVEGEHPRPFFSTSRDGVAMAIYCGFVVRGDIAFCG